MNEKTKAILAYIFGWVGGIIVLFGLKDNEKNTKIHAAQSIILSGGYWVLLIVYRYIPFTIPFFSRIVQAIYAIGLIIGIIKACKDEDPEIPVVGDLANKLFSKKIEE